MKNRIITFLFIFFVVTFPAAAQSPTGQCQSAGVWPQTECKEGGELLCVNSPSGGVVSEGTIVKGRFNLEGNALPHLSVLMQHDPTKKMRQLALSQSVTVDCWNASLSATQNYCLEESGKFSFYIPLPDLGAHTIFITAAKDAATSMETQVRVSRVIKPVLTSDLISYGPPLTDVKKLEQLRNVQVTIDLLKSCGAARDACDFIGASTGGVTVRIENPAQAAIRCETNISQAEVGKFTVGVPLLPGENKLLITVCNAATGAQCLQISSALFRLGGALAQIEILEPTSHKSFYLNSSQTSLPLSFKIAGESTHVCDDSVQVQWNLNESQKICADAEGIYKAEFPLEEGYNIGRIEAVREGHKLVSLVNVGQGKILTPFNAQGVLKSAYETRLPNALKLSISEETMNTQMIPIFNRFTQSEAFSSWLKEFVENIGRTPVSLSEQTSTSTLEGLSYCSKGKGLGDMRVKIMKSPKIGSLKLKPIFLLAGKVELEVNATDVELAVQLYKDPEGDGVADGDALPLKIAFKKLHLKPVLESFLSGDRSLWRLSSAYSDCDYKRDGVCRKMPSLLIPSQFDGAANSAGAYVTCDHSQSVSEKMDEICHALNVVDRQTGGVIQEKILDALNNAYACGGTESLAKLFADGIALSQENDWMRLEGKVGIEEMESSEEGLIFNLHTRFGSDEFLNALPEVLRKRQMGVILSSGVSGSVVSHHKRAVSIGAAFPIISQLSWGLQRSDGHPFQLVIDENFFRNTRDFDFDRDCFVSPDNVVPPPTLCKIRPRVSVIFGNTMSDLPPDESLQLFLVPSLAYPLRVSLIEDEKIKVELANWNLAIFARGERIITAQFSLRMVARLGALDVSPTDPKKWELKAQLIADESRLWMAPKPGTNTTLIPGMLLLSTLEDILKSAISLYSQEELVIPVPRTMPIIGNSLFEKLGIHSLQWGDGGFNLDWDSSKQSLYIGGTPILQ